MQINLSWDSSVASAPANFKADVQNAANQLGAAILNPASVTIQVGWNEIGGVAMAPGSGGLGGPSSNVLMDYYQGQAATNNAQVLAKLAGELSLNDLPALAANVPSANPFGSSELFLSATQAKAFGVPNLYPATFDGKIGLAEPSYTTDADMISAALHELAHALGRVNGWVSGGTTYTTTMDLFTYSAPGTLWNPASALAAPAGDTGIAPSGGYFSLDGGKTNLANFAAADVGDFTNAIADPFTSGDYGISNLTPLDNQVLQSLGFATASNTNAMTPGATAHAAANTVFTGTGSDTVAYTGS
ncbi:MAG: NF038122 family metalloprotease, partial [Betaproteobacteria bacterium]|nr:NF038122 family metalloprotease [Betaproteobacteria bacterium]